MFRRVAVQLWKLKLKQTSKCSLETGRSVSWFGCPCSTLSILWPAARGCPYPKELHVHETASPRFQLTREEQHQSDRQEANGKNNEFDHSQRGAVARMHRVRGWRRHFAPDPANLPSTTRKSHVDDGCDEATPKTKGFVLPRSVVEMMASLGCTPTVSNFCLWV